MNKKEQNEVRVTKSGVSVVKFNPKLVKKELQKMKITLEFHADGVKEVECPFCEVPCEEPHCPYTEEE